MTTNHTEVEEKEEDNMPRKPDFFHVRRGRGLQAAAVQATRRAQGGAEGCGRQRRWWREEGPQTARTDRQWRCAGSREKRCVLFLFT